MVYWFAVSEDHETNRPTGVHFSSSFHYKVSYLQRRFAHMCIACSSISCFTLTQAVIILRTTVIWSRNKSILWILGVTTFVRIFFRDLWSVTKVHTGVLRWLISFCLWPSQRYPRTFIVRLNRGLGNRRATILIYLLFAIVHTNELYVFLYNVLFLS